MSAPGSAGGVALGAALALPVALALSLASLQRALGVDGLADMAFLDPPYNVAYEGGTAAKMTIANDALGGGFIDFLRPAFTNLLAVTKGASYVCMSSSEWPTLHRAWQEAGGKWSSTIIWAKNTFALGRADYHQQFEAMLYGWKAGSQHYWCGARDQGNVWHFDKPARNDLHPTMKPVALVERAIRNSSKQRDTVLDLFGGSGTTTYGENIGVMAATRVYSTAAYWVAGIVAVLLGLSPKVGAVMAFRPYGNSTLGHVAAVSRVIDRRTILVSHANWSPIEGRRGQIEDNVKVVDVAVERCREQQLLCRRRAQLE